MSAASPGSLAEALRLLEENPERRLIAGCTDLMVSSPEERAGYSEVLDLLRVPELRGVCRTTDGGLEIGATTTFTELRRSPAVRESYPILAQAASVVGGWQVQNRATLGGNIVNASPAGDSLPALLALGAEVVLESARGRRVVPYDSFHLGYRDTALEASELLCAVRLPPVAAGTVQLYRKVGTREAQAISKVVVAAVGRVEDGAITDFRLAAGSVAATPLRLVGVEAEVVGRPAEAETADLAGSLASRQVRPIDDVRSTAEYRKVILGRVVRRLVLRLIAPPTD